MNANRKFLPFLIVLFVGSGCAALIYEIVWFQMLQLIIGSSAISLGILLGTFMGGMCVGSVMLSRIISSRLPSVKGLCAFGIGHWRDGSDSALCAARDRHDLYRCGNVWILGTFLAGDCLRDLSFFSPRC